MDYQDPYHPHQTFYKEPADSRPKRSALGIASFAIGIVSGIWEFIAVIAAGVMVASGDFDKESAKVILLGLGILAGMGLAVLGGIFGIAALCMPGRDKLFATLGLIFNALVLLGIIGLMVIGSTMPPP